MNIIMKDHGTITINSKNQNILNTDLRVSCEANWWKAN